MLVIKISKISLAKDVQNQVSFLFCKNLSFPFLVATLEFWKRISMGSNESIPRLGSLFQQRVVIPRLSLGLSFFGTP